MKNLLFLVVLVFFAGAWVLRQVEKVRYGRALARVRGRRQA